MAKYAHLWRPYTHLRLNFDCYIEDENGVHVGNDVDREICQKIKWVKSEREAVSILKQHYNIYHKRIELYGVVSVYKLTVKKTKCQKVLNKSLSSVKTLKCGVEKNVLRPLMRVWPF